MVRIRKSLKTRNFASSAISAIPIIDIAPLFGDAGADRDAVDRAIGAAAFDIGFMVVIGQPPSFRVGPRRQACLLRLFDMPPASRRPLWKRNFAPENGHLYRGWFPLASSPARNREGYEIGPDILRPLPDDGDILNEPTPLPPAGTVPADWRAVARDYFADMETLGFAILDAVSRCLAIDPAIFRDAFRDGISTLRLLHYPGDTAPASADDVANRFVEIDGEWVEQTARPHVDSGLLTILAQCGVGGLQALGRDDSWCDVPVRDDGFAVNFGGLMELWTGGCIRATRHRVLGRGRTRHSIPFFFEPRPSTRIGPLPIAGATPFTPFLYGDHLWALTTRFPENFGLEALRPPREPETLAQVPRLS